MSISQRLFHRIFPQKAGGGLQPARQSDIDRLLALWTNVPTGRTENNEWNAEAARLIKELILERMTTDELATVLAGLSSYSRTGVTSELAQQALIAGFCKTASLFQDLLHQILSRSPAGTSYLSGETSPYFGLLDGALRQELLTELRANGYAVLPFRLSDAVVQEMREASLKFDYIVRDPFNDSVPATVSNIDLNKPPACVAISAFAAQVAEAPLFKSLKNDPQIMSLVREYLDSDIEPIGSPLWYSFPTDEASSEGAQLYHFDLDTPRWLKVFYYLTDVTDETGPHVYVEGSHRPGAKSQELLNRHYDRIPDADMAKFQKGAVRSVTGPAGTIILGDTRCYHKGLHLRSGTRLIYSPIYSPTRIGFNQGR